MADVLPRAADTLLARRLAGPLPWCCAELLWPAGCWQICSHGFRELFKFRPASCRALALAAAIGKTQLARAMAPFPAPSGQQSLADLLRDLRVCVALLFAPMLLGWVGL
eukprot:11919031-Alexandrium_andersonii.AAC.1